MTTEKRARRIGEQLREELAELLRREIADPRLMGVTITEVQIDREIAYATIYVSSLETGERASEILQALEGAKGYLRRELAGRIRLRSFPQLRFQWDPTAERAARVEALLAEIRPKRPRPRRETRGS